MTYRSISAAEVLPPPNYPGEFSGAEEAWHWACTAVIARGQGTELSGPYDPDRVTEAAEEAGWDRPQWLVMVDAGLEGEPPASPIRLLVYYAALRKLDPVLRLRGLL